MESGWIHHCHQHLSSLLQRSGSHNRNRHLRLRLLDLHHHRRRRQDLRRRVHEHRRQIHPHNRRPCRAIFQVRRHPAIRHRSHLVLRLVPDNCRSPRLASALQLGRTQRPSRAQLLRRQRPTRNLHRRDRNFVPAVTNAATLHPRNLRRGDVQSKSYDDVWPDDQDCWLGCDFEELGSGTGDSAECGFVHGGESAVACYG